MTDEDPKIDESVTGAEPAASAGDPEAAVEAPNGEGEAGAGAEAPGAEPTAEEPPHPSAADLTPERREAATAVLSVVEAMLYAAGKPVSLEKMAEAADLPKETIDDALALLEESCGGEHRGVMLDRVAGGVRFVSRPEHDDCIRTLLGLDGRTKLSMASLETLAIVAYRQPITAPDIADLRGVSSASSIRTLLDRKLITTAGRKEVVGTPFLYKTTKEFLVHFGLSEIRELPKPEELDALYGVETPAADDGQKELFSPEETEALEENPEAGEEHPMVEAPAADDTPPGDNTAEAAAETAVPEE